MLTSNIDTAAVIRIVTINARAQFQAVWVGSRARPDLWGYPRDA
jgi:hypothetical protein